MKLISYLQQNLWISRRSIVWSITNGIFFLNWKKVESYKQEIENSDVLEIKDIETKKIIIKFEEKSYFNLLFFNKPKWYVVSKSDSNNQIIYDILPAEFKNYYYVGRLDKDSHWLLLLTDSSKLVDELSHPRNGIEKEYIVKIDNILTKIEIDKCLNGVYDDDELLKFKSISKIHSYLYKIILLEWKKRHIRRVFNSLWFKVIDLQRIREGEFELWNLKIWEYKLLRINESI